MKIIVECQESRFTGLASLSKTPLGDVLSAALIGAVTFLIAFIALSQLEETFGKGLDYFEPV